MMFVYATKVTVKKVAAGVLVLAAVLWGISALRPDPAQTATVAGDAGISQKLESNEARVQFLQSYGWEVSAEPTEQTEVRIPDTFEETYESYNALQQSQGLDLTAYQGRKADLYVYEVYNDPSGQSGVTANLVLYRNRLIAADICSAEKDGFLRTVTQGPEQATDQAE